MTIVLLTIGLACIVGGFLSLTFGIHIATMEEEDELYCVVMEDECQCKLPEESCPYCRRLAELDRDKEIPYGPEH